MAFLVIVNRRSLALGLALLLAAGAAQAEQRTLVVLGDSLSAAYNMPREDGWVHLLRERLQDQGHDWRVVNAAISGDTTRGGLSRLPAVLDQHRPALVIIQLGGNDGLRGVNPAETRENIERMARLAQNAGASVVVAGVRIPPNYGPAFSRRFEQSFVDAAEATGAALLPRILDQVDERQELIQSDGIHPTPEAQPRILDNVWSVLEPLL
ncbi:MAG: arylesterase [Ectothiorhodospiraceae bacterium]|nr:arylesterase [Ectothiorhodospiraceae bacterium]